MSRLQTQNTHNTLKCHFIKAAYIIYVRSSEASRLRYLPGIQLQFDHRDQRKSAEKNVSFLCLDDGLD